MDLAEASVRRKYITFSLGQRHVVIRRQRTGHIALFLLASLYLLTWYYRSRDFTSTNWDTLDYGQAARNIAQGKGFTTSTMPLMGLEWRRQTGRLDEPWWNVHRFPAPAYCLAVLIRCFGAHDSTLRLFSSAFFLATLPLLFVFARRHFSYPTALVASFMYAISGARVGLAVSGLSEPAFTFLILAVVLIVLDARRDHSLLLAGAVLGLAYLTRSNALLFMPALLWLVWSGQEQRRWWAISSFLAPFGCLATPWLIRTWLLTRQPTFSLTMSELARFRTPASGGTQDWFLFAYQNPAAFWMQHPQWVLQKWIKETVGLSRLLPRVGVWSDRLGIVFGLFLLGLAQHTRGCRARLRVFLFVALLTHATVLGFLDNNLRYYDAFTPFVFVLAADSMVLIYRTIRDYANVRSVLLTTTIGVGYLGLLLGYFLQVPQDLSSSVRTDSFNIDKKWLQQHTGRDALIVCDQPWYITWYAERRTIPLPPSPSDLGLLRKYHVYPDGIYLRKPSDVGRVPAGWKQWIEIHRTHRRIPGYRLVAILPNGGEYYRRVLNPPAQPVTRRHMEGQAENPRSSG